MRPKRQSGRRRVWGKARDRKDTLRPFLSAIKPETPPEGLLERIEREIETTGSKPCAPRRHAKASVILPLAAALVGVAILSVGSSKDRTDLLDPAGRPVARLETRGDVTTARLLGARVAAESRKSWHLWGIASAEEPPVHLGAIDGSEAFLTSPERFSGFAISLEDNGFSGNSPVGPVVPLARRK